MSINGLRYPNNININAGTIRLRGKTAGNVEIAPIICDSSVYVANLYCERSQFTDATGNVASPPLVISNSAANGLVLTGTGAGTAAWGGVSSNVSANAITANSISSITGVFSGNISAANAAIGGHLSATSFTVSTVSLASAVASGNVNALNLNASNNVTGVNILASNQLRSSVVTGTAPLVIASTTRVANLNVDLAAMADAASGLKSATTTVAVSSATAPSSGQVLTATSGTAATWQAPGGASSADAINSATTAVNTSSATAPSANQVLTATSSTAATWQAIGTATAANALKSASTTVSVSAATAPSAGQVLTATSSTAATWQTPSAGNTIYSTSVNLTANQIKNMSVTPVEIVAAPGAGLALVVLSASWSQTYVAPQYTAGTDPYLIFSSGTGASTGIATTADIRATANFVGIAPYATVVAKPNEALQITNPTTPFATGASTVKITVQYYILTV